MCLVPFYHASNSMVCEFQVYFLFSHETNLMMYIPTYVFSAVTHIQRYVAALEKNNFGNASSRDAVSFMSLNASSFLQLLILLFPFLAYVTGVHEPYHFTTLPNCGRAATAALFSIFTSSHMRGN